MLISPCPGNFLFQPCAKMSAIIKVGKGIVNRFPFEPGLVNGGGGMFCQGPGHGDRGRREAPLYESFCGPQNDDAQYPVFGHHGDDKD